MTKNILKLALPVVLLIAVSPAQGSKVSACYGTRCFQTVARGALVDHDKDYVYAEPSKFPTANLRPQYAIPARFIDLSTVSGATPLTADFKLNDFMIYDHGRYALFSPVVATIMQGIHDDIDQPVYVTSGYRSPGHNGSTAGSAQWSRHMYGDAVDFTSENPNFLQLQAECEKFGASFVLVYENHIHCDWRLLGLSPAFYDSTERTSVVGPLLPTAELRYRVNKAKRVVTVSAVLTSEDAGEGTPIFAWHVVNSTGSVFTSGKAALTLPFSGAPYKIDVVVGGAVHLQQAWAGP